MVLSKHVREFDTSIDNPSLTPYTVKTAILARGFETRISEEGRLKPKPMIEIDEELIL